MKKLLALLSLSVFSLSLLCGCSTTDNDSSSSGESAAAKFDTSEKIVAISREKGAGIRYAAADLFSIIESTAADLTSDLIFDGVTVKESAEDVAAAVSQEQYAIAYLPLNSVTEDVKAIAVNSVEPTLENAKEGKYSYVHKIYAVTKTDAGDAAEDFINFVLSEQGQNTIMDSSFISLQSKGDFSSKKPEGTLNITAPSSLQKLLQKLSEQYSKINSKLKIEITKANSTDSIKALKDKDSLAFTTRPISDSEKKDCKQTAICEEVIAVVVNKKNSIRDITSKQIKGIYKNEIKKWSEIIK